MRYLTLALCLVLSLPAFAQNEAPAQPDQRTIDMRQAPANFRLGVRVLTHRQQRAAAPVVVITPDEASYLEAISRWTPETIFPVLIDDGSARAAEDIARFVRAFAPDSIVRYEGGEVLPQDRAARAAMITQRFASIWDIEDEEDVMARLVSHWQFSVHAPPGVVVADANDPAWTGALALAAGHTQPILWYDTSPIHGGVDSDIGPEQVRALASFLEVELEFLGLAWGAPGDVIDAVTLAMNIPVKCNLPELRERDSERFALTDVIGKHDALTSPRGSALTRWAWAGQLIGNESESAYRAMCAMFIQPERAWVFDGYHDEAPWNTYDGEKIKTNLQRATLDVTLLDTPRQGLDNWLIATTIPLGADLIFVNTKGMADWFDLEPGRAHAGDAPILDRPAAVSFVHSWSATRPGDPNTIAGTFLRRGAFAYAGSVHEPYLQAFIPAPVLALRLVGGLPWAAAIRSDGRSPVWKITYLGDPLLAIGSPRPRTGEIDLDEAQPLKYDLAEALEAEDFVKAARTLVMMGRDTDAARLGSAVLKDQPEAFTPELAQAVAMAAFREHDKDLLVACVLSLDESVLDASNIGDALWHAAESDLRTGVTHPMSDALEKSIRGSRLVRDATRLAGSVEVIRGVEGRNAVLHRLAQRAGNDETRRRIESAKR